MIGFRLCFVKFTLFKYVGHKMGKSRDNLTHFTFFALQRPAPLSQNTSALMIESTVIQTILAVR